MKMVSESGAGCLQAAECVLGANDVLWQQWRMGDSSWLLSGGRYFDFMLTTLTSEEAALRQRVAAASRMRWVGVGVQRENSSLDSNYGLLRRDGYVESPSWMQQSEAISKDDGEVTARNSPNGFHSQETGTKAVGVQGCSWAAAVLLCGGLGG